MAVVARSDKVVFSQLRDISGFPQKMEQADSAASANVVFTICEQETNVFEKILMLISQGT